MNHDDSTFDDADIRELYHRSSDDGPSATLDAAILAQAEDAVRPSRRRPAWLAPLGLAATVVLGVNLAVSLKDYSSTDSVFSETVTVSQNAAANDTDRTTLQKQVVLGNTEDTEASAAAHTPPHNNADRASIEAREGSVALNRDITPPSAGPREYSPNKAQGSVVATDRPVASDTEAEPSGAATPQSRAGELLDAMRAGESAERVAAFSAGANGQASAEREAASTTDQAAAATTAPRQPPADTPPPDDRALASALSTLPAAMDRATSTDTRLSADVAQQAAPPGNAAIQPSPAPSEAQVVATADVVAEPSVADPVAIEELIMTSESSEADAVDEELQEVVVTGSRLETAFDDSPHRRLRAKDQVRRNAERGRKSATVSPPAEPVVAASRESRGVVDCDLSAMAIDQNRIDDAKTVALSFEPPLNAVTWPDYIAELHDSGDVDRACAQLAAFRSIFPEVLTLRPLPVRLIDAP